MITLEQFLKTVDYRITEGSEYCWSCYGDNAYSLSSWDGDHDGKSFEIIFDKKTQEVYEVQAFDFSKEKAYRIINPAYLNAYTKEASEREVDYREAWETVNFTDLEVDEDFLDKARDMFLNQEYDTRVQVPLTLDKDEMFQLMTLAHERDLTLNQMVEEILTLAIANATLEK